MNETTPSVWVEIDRAALAHNARETLRQVTGGARLMAVVKANGYGHGLVEAARTFTSAGAWGVGVSTVDEGLVLRHEHLSAPVLCFAPALPDQLSDAVVNGLSLTIHDREHLRAAARTARQRGIRAACHLEVDTGMGRGGCSPADAAALAAELTETRELDFAGVYTHLATAQEPDPTPALEQWTRFERVLGELDRKGLRPPLRHCANSAALLRLPETHLDLVRPGTMLYGDFPAPFLERPSVRLRRGFALCTRIVTIREVPTGATVGYGGEWRAPRPTRVGLIPLGWAEGLTVTPQARTPSIRSAAVAFARLMWGAAAGRTVRIGNASAPLLGRVGMQMTSLDLTALPRVGVGDRVVVPCRKTAVPDRIPRIYTDKDQASRLES